MRVLVTGATGLLGRALMKAFSDAELTGVALSRATEGLVRLDLRRTGEIEALVEDLRPDIIVHSAAERRPDVCEKDPEGTRALNVEATAALARSAAACGAWILYTSTDYVFDGTNPPYAVDAPTHPLNAYGESKLQGERALWEATRRGGVLRMPILYGPSEHAAECVVVDLAALVHSGEPAKLDDWAIRFPTFTDDVAAICRELCGRALDDRDFSGTWHFSGRERLTKYGMAVAIAEYLGLPHHPFEPDPNPGPGASRPKNSQLDGSVLEKMGIGKPTPFREGLGRVIDVP